MKVKGLAYHRTGIKLVKGVQLEKIFDSLKTTSNSFAVPSRLLESAWRYISVILLDGLDIPDHVDPH